ncbi:hypothetical protein [Streptomyces sp. NBC_00645]|uniref:hypothetical protein n=1 Tax=Streptomyces sp. NBC_00645 TaxID=2975795 RepID=UPI00386CB7C2
MPNDAASVAALLGISTVPAFDVNAACAGFRYGLGIADGLIRSGTSLCAPVVGAERMTDWVDPTEVDTPPRCSRTERVPRPSSPPSTPESTRWCGRRRPSPRLRPASRRGR